MNLLLADRSGFLLFELVSRHRRVRRKARTLSRKITDVGDGGMSQTACMPFSSVRSSEVVTKQRPAVMSLGLTMSKPTSPGPQPVFATTRWTLVLAAARTPSPESAAALETICRTYWYPLYAYARRSGLQASDAEDMTQEFFRHLLEKHWLANADREKGRLRSFLVTALKHFMAKEWRRASAQKRGGGQTPVPIDTTFAESRYASVPCTEIVADELFDRQWAMTLLEVTLERLEKEYAGVGRAAQFAGLKVCLTGGQETIDYGEVSTLLGMNEGAARVAVHRLRKRFREVYREEIVQTLPEGADPDDEMRHLGRALVRA